jgi:putative intracellular protease/amidase
VRCGRAAVESSRTNGAGAGVFPTAKAHIAKSAFEQLIKDPNRLTLTFDGGLATSPTPLHAQAFGKIAAEQMLSEMHELAVEIDPNLATHVAPATAERIVLR